MPYKLALNGREYPPGTLSFTAAVAKVTNKAALWGGRYRVKPSREEPWGEEVGRPAMLWAVQRAMRKSPWNGLIRISMGSTAPGGPKVFLLKKVMSEDPVPVPSEPLKMYTGAVVDLSRGNDRIAKAAQFAKDHNPRVMCSGWVYTRPVSGTSVWSQHSRWPEGGNAVDLTVYNNDTPGDGIDMAATIDVADTLIAAARAGQLDLWRVIVANRQYIYPRFEAKDYGGVYHTHVHAEGRPIQTGTPVDAP